MDNGYVELILSRIAAVAEQQDRQTTTLRGLEREFASILALLASIDKRLDKIEHRAAR
jgi:hypothetical protein